MIRIFFIVAGVILASWFALPFFSHRILNIGNITGIAVGLLLFLSGVFFLRLAAAGQALKQMIWGRVFLILCAVLLVFVIGTALLETALIVRAAKKKPEKSAVLIVLGCRVYGERPSRSLRERMDAALIYMEENPDVVCSVSGGKGDGESISEAECMYRYLVKKGVDPERIIKEEESTSTRENLLFSKKILEERNLGKNIAIATSEYHEYRAGQIAASLGLSAGAVPGRTAWWLFPTFYVRELYGILYQNLPF